MVFSRCTGAIGNTQALHPKLRVLALRVQLLAGRRGRKTFLRNLHAGGCSYAESSVSKEFSCNMLRGVAANGAEQTSQKEKE